MKFQERMNCMITHKFWSCMLLQSPPGLSFAYTFASCALSCAVVDWLEGANWGDTKGVGSSGEQARKFLNLKVKMAHFCALLSLQVNHRNSLWPHLKDSDKSSVFLPFYRVSEAKTRLYCDSEYKQHFFHTLHYRTAQGRHCSWYTEMEQQV